MNLLLYEDFPLRTTRVLGDYADDKPLGLAFGDLTGARFDCLRLSSTDFFVADHVFDVTSCFTDGQKTESFEASLQSDGKGNTWTIVTIGSPVPEGSIVSVCGFGMKDPATGALIENPGDVLAELSRRCGRSDDWQQIRDEASTLGLRVAGRVFAVASIQSIYDEVTQSVGGIWASGIMSRIYPADVVDPPILRFEGSALVTLGIPKTSIDDTFDILRLGYGFSDSSNKALRFIELTASPQQFGGVVKEVTYKWLRSSVNAEGVGRRVLGRGAGERYDVPFSTDAGIRPGTWVELVAHPGWPCPGPDPQIMVLAVEHDDRTGEDSITGETVLSTPTITVTGHSIALPDTVGATVDVVTKNGITTITISDLDGKPLKGARCSVDGGAPKTTNDRGQVSYILSIATHHLECSAPGKDTFELDFESGAG